GTSVLRTIVHNEMSRRAGTFGRSCPSVRPGVAPGAPTFGRRPASGVAVGRPAPPKVLGGRAIAVRDCARLPAGIVDWSLPVRTSSPSGPGEVIVQTVL